MPYSSRLSVWNEEITELSVGPPVWFAVVPVFAVTLMFLIVPSGPVFQLSAAVLPSVVTLVFVVVSGVKGSVSNKDSSYQIWIPCFPFLDHKMSGRLWCFLGV